MLYCECVRAVASGVLETASSTFLLLIAVRYFHSGQTAKGLLAASAQAGLALTPFVVHWVGRKGWRASRAAALFCGIGGGALLASAVVMSFSMRSGSGIPAWLAESVFIAGNSLGMLCGGAVVPLITQLYQDNYPDRRRGALFARAFMLRIATAAFFGLAAGKMLEYDFTFFLDLLYLFASASFLACVCLACAPARPLRREASAGPMHALRWVRRDPVFRRTLLLWMFVGFANLVMTPMRTEYLANPRYRLDFDPATIALLTLVIPCTVRFALSPVWGWLFDHVNFFRLRLAINAGFALGILTFFTGESLVGLFVGAVFYGVAGAGADVAWNLWVTKLARPDHVADYMSVHTLFTGLRGLVAPVVAFEAARCLPMWALGALTAALIVVGSLLILPEARNHDSRALGATGPRET
jgi:MFS family permease